MGTTESTDLETSLSVNDFNLNEIVINNLMFLGCNPKNFSNDFKLFFYIF